MRYALLICTEEKAMADAKNGRAAAGPGKL